MSFLKQMAFVAVLATGTTGQVCASEWIACAGENQYCEVPGTQMVRYGAGDRWSMKKVTRGIMCSNDVFGDPAPGVSKACYYQKTGSHYGPPDDGWRQHSRRDDGQYGGWTQCAGEGGYCNFHGYKEIRYGVDGRWNYKTAKNGIGCSNSVFGDPAPGAVKSCYYRNTAPPRGADDGRHVRWVRCAGEGGYCNFNGYREIRYGSGDRWNYKSGSNGIGCNNGVFGDPAPGSPKECFIKVD